MEINAETIILLGSLLASVTAIFGVIFKVHKWYLKQERQEEEINKLKEENGFLCFGISACLDGLMQLGANHNVPRAKEKLDKHLNEKAHERNDLF